MKTDMEKELELLDQCEDRMFLKIDDSFGLGEEEHEKLCEEIGAEMQGDLTIRNWNSACKAVQARRAAA